MLALVALGCRGDGARSAEPITAPKVVEERPGAEPEVAEPDARIAGEVRAVLDAEPFAAGDEIDVIVEDGVVTLSGRVADLPRKRLAEEVTGDVRGVREVVSRIRALSGQPRAEGEIRSDTPRREGTVRLSAEHIEVTARDGEVVLRGVDRPGAEPGAEGVIEWLGPPDDRGVSDRRIEVDVARALREDALVPAVGVEVDVAAGLVTLTGVVASSAARLAAERAAREVSGVEEVYNLIEVEGALVIPDDVIAAQVQRALAYNPYVRMDRIEVEVDDGTVRLSGAVPTAFQRQEAERLVVQLEGVRGVVNRVEVYPRFRGALSDAEIEANIRAEMSARVYVDPSAVEIEVEGGVATLRGQVGNRLAYQAAIRSAYQGGADRVISELRLVPLEIELE